MDSETERKREGGGREHEVSRRTYWRCLGVVKGWWGGYDQCTIFACSQLPRSTMKGIFRRQRRQAEFEHPSLCFLTINAV